MGPSSPSMTAPPGEAEALKGPETPMPSSPGDRVNRVSVRAGATLWVLGVAGFLFGMGVTQLGWDLLRSGPTPVYSLLHNYISDLGAVSCGPLPGRYVCSPWHEVFDLSAVALGTLLILGSALLWDHLPGARSSSVGLVFLLLAGIGAMGVGLSPEDVNLTVHTASAAVAFLFANLGVLVLGIGWARLSQGRTWGAYSIVSGLVGLLALGLFGLKAYGPLYVGGMERLVVAPVLLWAILVGVAVLVGRRGLFAGGLAPKDPAPP